MTMQRRTWRDMSPLQRAATMALGAVQIALLAAALVDIRRRPRDEIRGPKPLWTALSFINFAGPIAYFTLGRKR